MRQHAGSLFLQWSTVLRIGACSIQCRQGDMLLGHVLGTLCEDVQGHVAHVPSCSPAFSDVTQVYDVKEQPRPQVSSRYPSEQKKLGIERDSSLAYFPEVKS